jgi:hypothetical protein
MERLGRPYGNRFGGTRTRKRNCSRCLRTGFNERALTWRDLNARQRPSAVVRTAPKQTFPSDESRVAVPTVVADEDIYLSLLSTAGSIARSQGVARKEWRRRLDTATTQPFCKRSLHDGKDSRISGAPDVIDRAPRDDPSVAISCQFDIVAVFHQIMASVIASRDMLGFDESVQSCLITVDSDTRVGHGMRRIQCRERGH